MPDEVRLSLMRKGPAGSGVDSGMAEITGTQLAKLTGYTKTTILRERKAGRLQGEKRPGVRSIVYDKRAVITWLRYKCLSHLIDTLP